MNLHVYVYLFNLLLFSIINLVETESYTDLHLHIYFRPQYLACYVLYSKQSFLVFVWIVNFQVYNSLLFTVCL